MDKVLGAEQTLSVDLKDGNLVVLLCQSGHDGGVKIEGTISLDRIAEKVKAKIPGQIDDAVINLALAALKQIK